MKNIPIFVETEEAKNSSEACICSKIVDRWLAIEEYGPLGFANNISRINSIFEKMKDHDLTPSIFIVNTYSARPILAELDKVVGDIPILFLRRRLFAGKSGLQEFFGETVATSATVMAISKMRPRLTSIWYYGSKTIDYMALETTPKIFRFCQDKDFKRLEVQPMDIV